MRFLLLNQAFHPDVVASGQYLAEIAVRLAERGHEVTVVTSRRAYDHPERLFPKRETWNGVRIERIWSTGFGKRAKWHRAVDFASFMVACTLRLLFTRRPDAILALTSPPLISFLGACVAKLRGSRFYYWILDFNPDEAIAAGWLRPGSLAARLLEGISRFSLRQATKVIALDRFMRDRVTAKGIPPENVAVVSPWSHDGEVRFDPEGRARFRKAHSLDGKFVVMYSGNHSPCHPLETLLAAADRLRHERDIVFCFVGGGSEWRKIRDGIASGTTQAGLQQPATPDLRPPTSDLRPSISDLRPPPSALRDSNGNLLCLPYQPLNTLAASLSAADLHVVVMGNAFVGLVHPCKIYNILSVAAPVLYIGPQPSHVSEIMAHETGPKEKAERHASSAVKPAPNGSFFGWARHGEVDQVVQVIQSVRQATAESVRQPTSAASSQFSKETLLPKMISLLEAS